MIEEASLPEPDLAALLDELNEVAPEAGFFTIEQEEALPPPFPAAADPGRPASFAFGQTRGSAPERLTAFERVTEKLARALQDVIEPFARTRAVVNAPAPEILCYGAWTAKLPAFTSLSLYRLRPLKGGMLVALSPDFIAGLVESFYGGAPTSPRKPKTGDFTTSEEMLLKRLLGRTTEAIAELWRDYAEMEPQLAQRETSTGYLNWLRDEDEVVLQRFAVAIAGQQTVIDLVYPLGLIRPIEARLASKVHDDGEHANNDAWRARLGTALAQVSLPVRSVLARPEMSVAQLLALKVGDVIPITLAPRTPLLAGTHVIADGVIGEQEGRAALMIEKVGN